MPGNLPKFYSSADAAKVLNVQPAVLLRALAQLPALQRRNGAWTIEDLSQIDGVVKAMVVPEFQRKGMQVSGTERGRL